MPWSAPPLLARFRPLLWLGACFLLLCALLVIAVLSPVTAAAVFILIAGSAHLLWRAFL